MYYYIFDIKKFKKRSQVEEIRNHLSVLGISGEFTYPTPMQSVEELVDTALSKKYTTIVGVGGDEIANTIANKLLGRKEALGIVPIESSPELMELVGATNWKEACEALRFRKLAEIRLGQTASGNVFLTHLRLDIKNPIEVTAEFKSFLVQAKLKSLIIANFYPNIQKIGDDHLDVLMTSADAAEGGLAKKLGLFLGKKTEDNRNFSLFRARSLRVFTKTPMALFSNHQLIAKTPQLIESSDDKLRLIIAKK